MSKSVKPKKIGAKRIADFIRLIALDGVDEISAYKEAIDDNPDLTESTIRYRINSVKSRKEFKALYSKAIKKDIIDLVEAEEDVSMLQKKAVVNTLKAMNKIVDPSLDVKDLRQGVVANSRMISAMASSNKTHAPEHSSKARLIAEAQSSVVIE